MNNDKLNSTAAHAVAVSAFAVIDQLQDLPKHMQVNALAVLYKLFMEELNLNHSELLTRANLIVKDADMYYHSEIKALRSYIREELKV